ncbi:PREDICTED: uncharacterized protein LOC100487674 [Pelobates cultripes]|uniref:PREDICTED: uncharacterized protein LOC100487674 n=1 Tax=Pelobates cultripes TaxID=61616 RepID=A0AAD1W664_PELCU|nr:PREDICTED: uncharacterized protein LOC100487674 [Pelobates cultripes]
MINQASIHKRKQVAHLEQTLMTLRTLEAQHKLNPMPETNGKIAECQTKIKKYMAKDSTKALLWSKQLFYDKANKADTLLARKLKQRTERKQITKINTPEGTLTEKPSEIAGVFQKYFEALYDHSPTTRQNPTHTNTLINQYLQQAQNWHAPYGVKRWVDLEHDIFGRDFPSLYIWLQKSARPPLPRTSPAILNTINIWDKTTHKSGLTTQHSPLTPLLRNTHFPPGMTPKDFARFEANDLTRLFHYYKNQQPIPFPELPHTTPYRNLSRADKELLIVATSAYNKCPYCVTAHGAQHIIHSKNPRLAYQVIINWGLAELNQRERAMVEFALAIAKPENITEIHFKQLEKHGLDREDAWDIAAITAFFAMANRLAYLMDLQPNDEFCMS